MTVFGLSLALQQYPPWSLFAETIFLEAKKTDRFLVLVESLFEEHDPRTPTEKLLVENIAAARWRQWRIWGMQKVAFDDEVALALDNQRSSSPRLPSLAKLAR